MLPIILLTAVMTGDTRDQAKTDAHAALAAAITQEEARNEARAAIELAMRVAPPKDFPPRKKEIPPPPKINPPAVSKTTSTTTTKTITTYRNPVGHTHTCPNGHTWDHQSNPGHHCKICGAEPPKNARGQWITDSPARKVPVTQTLVVPVEPPPPAPPPPQPAAVAAPATPRPLTPLIRSLGGTSWPNDCPGGY